METGRDITEVPRIDNSAAHTTNIGQSYSTRWLTSSDYLNLRSVTIGYKFPSLNSLQLFVQADNLLTFSKNQGLDPEQGITGLTYYRYPAMRSISGGLNVSF